MKNHVICAAAVAIATVSGCASRAPSANTTQLPAAFESSQAEVRVAGLSCPLCAESLIATVDRIDGVESSALDLEEGRLTLAFGKSRPAPSEIAAAIENAGFTLVGFGPATK